MFDNRVFNVNGQGEEMLLAALGLAFAQVGKHTRCRGWAVTKKDGLILTWTLPEQSQFRPKVTGFPSGMGMSIEKCVGWIMEWLESDEAKEVECVAWDKNESHDGSNNLGWRVHCGDWGRVAELSEAICAVKPAYIWSGK